jgi:hypothetical protein
MFFYGKLRSAAPCFRLRQGYGGQASRVVRQKLKTPNGKPAGFLLWRRPTLARPVAVLPSGLQCFTSVFGMGTGGATTLLSPEFCAEISAQNSSEDFRLPIADLAVCSIGIQLFKEHRLQIPNLKSAIFNCWFSGIYIREEECDSRFVTSLHRVFRFTI